MTDRIYQHGLARTAAFMAALALVLPPVAAGRACGCPVTSAHAARCCHCNNESKDATPMAVMPCCQRHASADQSSAHGLVCHCQHGQQSEPSAVPVGQTQLTVDQLMHAQSTVSTPLVAALPTVTAASSAHLDHCLAADTSLERCVLLSRLTL
jgi:hypothetical protein